jgi:positive regulator of sigma E activity
LERTRFFAIGISETRNSSETALKTQENRIKTEVQIKVEESVKLQQSEKLILDSFTIFYKKGKLETH